MTMIKNMYSGTLPHTFTGVQFHQISEICHKWKIAIDFYVGQTPKRKFGPVINYKAEKRKQYWAQYDLIKILHRKERFYTLCVVFLSNVQSAL